MRFNKCEICVKGILSFGENPFLFLNLIIKTLGINDEKKIFCYSIRPWKCFNPI